MLWAALLFILIFPDEILACSGCYKQYLSYVEPYWKVLFKGSVYFGLSSFLVITLFNKTLIRRSVKRALLLLVISGIVYFFATDGMIGPPAFYVGMALCILWPLYSYLKFMRIDPAPKKRFRPLAIISVMFFIIAAVSAYDAAQAKAESDKYLDKYLPEMLRYNYGVVMNYYALDQLLLIQDRQKIKRFKPVLIPLLDSEYGNEKKLAQEVLDKWATITSAPE